MELVKIQTPLTDLKADSPLSSVVLQGGLQVTSTVNTAQSFQLSPSPPISALWTINPPSNQTIINRRIMVRSYLQFDFVGGAPSIGTNDASACLPFASICDVVTLTINGESTSENVSDKLQALMCYGCTREDRIGTLSKSPCFPDSYQSYSDWSIYGTGRSPLAFFGENSSESPRGGFVYTQISPTRYQIEVCEPLWLSPLDQFGREKEGMVNVNQLSVNIRFKSDTSRAWSHSSLGNPITSVTTSFYRAPELILEFVTPNLLDKLPLVQNLNYVKSQEYVKTVPSLSAGQSTSVISDTIRLSQIPKAIYVFCRHSDATTDFTTPQSFLAITNLSVNWCNQSSLFAQMTQQGLFEMSVCNGLTLDYPSFTKYRGSVLCIKPAKDIGLLDSEAPSTQGSYNIQIQLGVKNTSSGNFDAQFYMCVVNEGVFSIGQNSARSSLGVLTPELVLSARPMEGVDYNTYLDMNGGSSFWSNLKKIVGRVARTVSSVAKPLSSVLPAQYGAISSGVGNVADALATSLGAGNYVGGMSSSRLIGGRRRK